MFDLRRVSAIVGAVGLVVASFAGAGTASAAVRPVDYHKPAVTSSHQTVKPVNTSKPAPTFTPLSCTPVYTSSSFTVYHC